MGLAGSIFLRHSERTTTTDSTDSLVGRTFLRCSSGMRANTARAEHYMYSRAMWGGLRPIPSRLALDVATIVSLTFCAFTEPNEISNHVLLGLAAVVTVTTAGLTHRWTISFPLVPFLVLQALRRLHLGSGWIGLVIGALSSLFILLSTALSILFPAVELQPVKGKYNVGIIDLHLPVDFSESKRRGSLLGTQHQDEITARILYPTDEEAEDLPYLDPEFAPLLCDELMKAGAPGPLKRLGWMLHTWRLTHIRAKRNAQPSDQQGQFPLAVYSHGLTGIAAIYSYQALHLAASGTVVLMVDHTDRSAVATRRRDSTHLLYDPKPVTDIYMKGKEVEYVRKRRAQTQHRVEECLSALSCLKSLNHRNIPDLASVGVSFVGKLDTADITLMGHSFGGCTVLSAAAQRPDLVSAVVAHEPAIDWMPDLARRALFSADRIEQLEAPYSGGTGGYEDSKGSEEKKDDCQIAIAGGLASIPGSIHDINMLYLYSDEWATLNWGAFSLIKSMHENCVLGPKQGTTDVGVIQKAKHQEFSDSCMLTPTWLARATGLTGERNPHETAAEIATRTLEFLEATRRSRRERTGESK